VLDEDEKCDDVNKIWERVKEGFLEDKGPVSASADIE